MARKRMVDPKFWSDDKIIELQPISRLCFIGLWNFCDDNGVHKNNAKVIKAEIFPADDMSIKDIEKIVNDLLECGLLEISEDDLLLRMRNWNIYQKINRPQPSTLVFTERSLNVHGTVTPNRIEKNIIEDSNGQTDELFEEFYSLYPRKVQKERAKRSFKKLSTTIKVTAIESLKKHIENWSIKRVEKEFIPHPASWINGRSWKDELETNISDIERVITPKEVEARDAFKRTKERLEKEKEEETESSKDVDVSGFNSLNEILKIKRIGRIKYYGEQKKA
jgi:hypothetical protein